MFLIFQIIYGKPLKLRTDCFRYLLIEYGLFVRISSKSVTKKLINPYFVQETYQKSVHYFSPHCSTKLSLALCKVATNIQARLDMSLEKSRKEKREVIEGAELQITVYLLVLQSLQVKFCLQRARKIVEFFYSCLEEVSSMIRI